MINPELQLKKLNKKPVEVQRGKLFTLLTDAKCDIFFAVLGALISGGLMPCTGFVTAKGINALCEQDRKVVKDDGFFYAMMFLIVAVYQIG